MWLFLGAKRNGNPGTKPRAAESGSKGRFALLPGCSLPYPPRGSGNCCRRAVEEGRNEGDVCLMARAPNPDRRLRVNEHVRPRCFCACVAERDLVSSLTAMPCLLCVISRTHDPISSLLDSKVPVFCGFQIDTDASRCDHRRFDRRG